MPGPINLLARGYRLQVSVDGSTNWLTFSGLNDMNPSINPNNVDASDYESNGWSASEITMYDWSIQIKANRKATSGVEDPAFAAVRACQGQFGDSARLYVRWFRKDGIAEAWSGRAIVSATPSKTGVADLNEWNVTFTGDGILTPITNPYAAGVAPTILSASPSGVATGGVVQITGQGFAGTVPTTGVKFGGTNATSWIVQGDTSIVAVMPAGSAGSAAVTVTNATGTSSSFPYTRG